VREGCGARTFGGRDDVVAEEVGEDLAELDLEVRGARGGAGGGGGGGGDELAELVDVGEVAGHRRRTRGRPGGSAGRVRPPWFCLPCSPIKTRVFLIGATVIFEVLRYAITIHVF